MVIAVADPCSFALLTDRFSLLADVFCESGRLRDLRLCHIYHCSFTAWFSYVTHSREVVWARLVALGAHHCNEPSSVYGRECRTMVVFGAVDFLAATWGRAISSQDGALDGPRTVLRAIGIHSPHRVDCRPGVE